MRRVRSFVWRRGDPRKLTCLLGSAIMNPSPNVIGGFSLSKAVDLSRRRIKKAREDLGMSQQDMAQRYGVSQAKISNLESGRVQLTVDDLIQFAKMTGKPLSYFFPDELWAGSVSGLSADESTLLALFREVEDEGMRQVISEFVSEQVSIYRKAVELSRLKSVSQKEKTFRLLDQLLTGFAFEVTEGGDLKVLSGDAEVLLSMTEDLDREELREFAQWRKTRDSAADSES